MSHYKNFRAVVYCTAQSMVRISPEGLQRQIDFFQKYVGVDKVYLEPYRDDCLIPREQLHMCKELFRKNGIEVAGGITTTISGQGEADAGRQRLFNTYCFCNERMRNHLKETVEYIASEFDEFIIDDFFFTIIQKKELNVFGSRNAMKKDFLELIDLVKAGGVDLEKIVTNTYKMKDAPKAFEEFSQNAGKMLKVVIDFT